MKPQLWNECVDLVKALNALGPLCLWHCSYILALGATCEIDAILTKLSISWPKQKVFLPRKIIRNSDLLYVSLVYVLRYSGADLIGLRWAFLAIAEKHSSPAAGSCGVFVQNSRWQTISSSVTAEKVPNIRQIYVPSHQHKEIHNIQTSEIFLRFIFYVIEQRTKIKQTNFVDMDEI